MLKRTVTTLRDAFTYARWIQAGKPSPPPHVVKQRALKQYARQYGLKVLVETGTYYGHMVAAMKPHFDRIYSIELGRELFDLARQKFAKDSHISILHGDSGEVLRELLADINEPCLFWLDAHYSVGVTACGDKQSPILAELAAILSHPVPGHVVLVDDVREFGVKDEWPSLVELGEFVASYDESLNLTVHDDILRITIPPASVSMPRRESSPRVGLPTLSFPIQPYAARVSGRMEKEDSPLVSVITPIYNYARFIEQTIQSVLNQTLRSFEIIVVDDGSTDNTREIVARFGSQVRYVWQHNSGQGAARNRGIKEARGKFIALLDADDYWMADKLEKQIKVFQNDPDLGLVYSLFYYFESESGAIVGYKPIAECFRGHVLREMFQSCLIGSPTPLIRREVFDSVGLFREDLKGVEDYEMWLRISAQFRIDFVSEVLAMYRVHQSGCADRSCEMWTQLMIAVLTKCQQSNPSITVSNLNKRIAQITQYAQGRNEHSRNNAERFYQRGKVRLARNESAILDFIKSLYYCPWRLTAWAGFLLCFLPRFITVKVFSGQRAIFTSQTLPSTKAQYTQY
ncbi:MAG: glycosyltransferase [Pyrinomonadaceae bacterium]